jgi:hypothetical protein
VVFHPCGIVFLTDLSRTQYEDKIAPRLRSWTSHLKDARFRSEPRTKTKAGSKIPGALKHGSLHRLRDDDVLYSYHCWCAFGTCCSDTLVKQAAPAAKSWTTREPAFSL